MCRGPLLASTYLAQRKHSAKMAQMENVSQPIPGNHRNNYPTISQSCRTQILHDPTHNKHSETPCSRWKVKKHNAETWTNKKKSKPQFAPCEANLAATCADETKHVRRRNSPLTNLPSALCRQSFKLVARRKNRTKRCQWQMMLND